MEGIVRRAGYYPSFHWPQEMLDFVKEARKEVSNLGFSEDMYYIRIRPELYEGKVQIRGDVKAKSGGNFKAKAVWADPPACKEYWAQVSNLFKPRVIGFIPTAPATRSAAAVRLAADPASQVSTME